MARDALKIRARGLCPPALFTLNELCRDDAQEQPSPAMANPPPQNAFSRFARVSSIRIDSPLVTEPIHKVLPAFQIPGRGEHFGAFLLLASLKPGRGEHLARLLFRNDLLATDETAICIGRSSSLLWALRTGSSMEFIIRYEYALILLDSTLNCNARKFDSIAFLL